MAKAKRNDEYEAVGALLEGPLPAVAHVLRSKNPRMRIPLTAVQFRRFTRMVWEHGYEYGIAHQLEQGAAMMRSVADQIKPARTEGYHRRAVRGQRKGLA